MGDESAVNRFEQEGVCDGRRFTVVRWSENTDGTTSLFVRWADGSGWTGFQGVRVVPESFTVDGPGVERGGKLLARFGRWEENP